MTDEKPIKLKFADDFTSPTLVVDNGDYHREFNAKDQPFEVVGAARDEKDSAGNDRKVTVVTAKHELSLLMQTGHFVVVEGEEQSAKSKEPVPPAARGAQTGSPSGVQDAVGLKSIGKSGGAPAEP